MNITKEFKQYLILGLTAALVLSIVIVSPWQRPQQAKATWYNNSWGYRQKIVIDHTKVSNTNQTDFPILVKITDTNNPIFTQTRDDGADLVFTGANQGRLYFEIENFSKANHELYAWVKIPTLSFSSDTEIYLYYGNPTATSEAMPTGVWSNGFAGVWHLGEASGNTLDSTVSGITGTLGSGITQGAAGKLGKSYTLSGTGAVNLGNSSLLPAGTSPRTMCAWGKPASVTSGWRWAMSYGTAGVSQAMFVGQNSSTLYGGSYGDDLNSANFWTLNEWKYSCVTYDGTKAALYGQGSQLVAPTSKTWNLARSATYIGAQVTGGEIWAGGIDEVRVSSVARSADWIATEYANQNSPETFISLQAQEQGDFNAPTNPSTVVAKNELGGAMTLSASNYYNYPSPYFEWPVAGQAGGATDDSSGVAGYYLYFGTSCGDSGADPALTRGILSDTGGGLSYITGNSVGIPSALTNEIYCLRIKTKDVFGNISSVSELFSYKFENTIPSQPTYVASNPAGYSSTNSFSFTWPAVSDTGGSGLAGYQYKRGGTSGDSWSTTITQTSISGIQSYQTGENIFYIRAIDNAGNVSDEAQTNYYYASNAPAKPTNLTASPDISDSNSFSFTWTAPVHDIDIDEYGYSINAVPTAQNIIWTGSNNTTLSAGPYATAQGVNTIYLIAKDTAGNYAFDQANYATATFTCQTSAPPTPIALSAVDSSDRAINRWMITIQWAAGIGQDSATFDHYSIERSIDGSTYSELATTTSTAYIDADLSNTTTYYYRVKAVDNADSESIVTQSVSKLPTGNYPTPPTIVSDPVAEVKATSATVTWVTNRASTGAVKFGTSENSLDRSQLDAQEQTEHQITLPGLEPSTTYYFKVQSLDSARDYSENDAYSSIFTFKTLAAPGIQNVKITNISLNSADVSWETSSASTTLIRYGTTINYDKSWEDGSSYTTKHTFKFENLDHTSTYHFKISGLDADENNINSDDYVFDTLPLPKISAVSFETDYNDAQPQTSISWTTNVPTTSSVEYYPKGGGNVAYEESQSDLISAHKVKLTKLSDDTSYSFYVSGTDQFGNKATSDEYIFNTPFDSRPAVITEVQVETSNVGLDKQDKSQLIVSWKTDELATTQVEYGEGVSGDYTNKTSEDQTLTNDHFVIISDLEPSKPYHLRVISKDKGGNQTLSDDINSIPGEVPRSLLKVLLSTFENIFG